MKYLSSLILTIFALSLAATPCFAQVDPQFHPGVAINASLALDFLYVGAYQPDGKMLVIGRNDTMQPDCDVCSQAHEDGSQTTSFTCGVCDPNFAAWFSLALQTDGKRGSRR